MFDVEAVVAVTVLIGVFELGLGLLVGGMIAYGQRRSPTRRESNLVGHNFE